MRPIQTDELTLMPTNGTDDEAWTELIVRIDNHMTTPQNRKILVRCETNIFNLYRGAAEAELKVNDDGAWMHGAKVSPTTDQRSSGTSTKNGDPDNSALLANAINLNVKYLNVMLVLQLAVLFVMHFTS